MRRYLLIAIVLVLVGAACGGEDDGPSAGGDTPAAGAGEAGGEGGAAGEEGGGAAGEEGGGAAGEEGGGAAGEEGGGAAGEEGGGAGAGAGGATLPPVSPSIPGLGEPSTIESTVESQGADSVRITDDLPRPSVRVVRTPAEAQRVARFVPPGAAEAVTGWDAYRQEALVVVLGGAQPDRSYRIRVDSISVTEGGEVIVVFGALTQQAQAAAQVTTIPWAVASIDAGAAVSTQRCVLALEGQSTRQLRCV